MAIENARLFEHARAGSELFQRLLLPTLSDPRPYEGAAVYRPATTPARVGGDWYDAFLLPDRACAAVIGDVCGHDLKAAAAMAQTRNMLRALVYDRRTPPSAVLTQLDRTLHAITDNPLTTACLARIEPEGSAWTLRWSNAGHLPPLVITPGQRPKYLHADPGVPLGVDADQPHSDHTHPLSAGSTVVFFTDGLIEHPQHPIDTSLDALAQTAATHGDLSLNASARPLSTTTPATATTTWPSSPCARPCRHSPSADAIEDDVTGDDIDTQELSTILRSLRTSGRRRPARLGRVSKVLPGARAVCANDEHSSVVSGVEVRQAGAHGFGIAERGD